MDLSRLADDLGITSLLAQTGEIWQQGGWAMWPIATLALVMFCMGLHIWGQLRGKAFKKHPESEWRRWINRPQDRRGKVGEILDAVGRQKSSAETVQAFEEITVSETLPIERDLKVMKVCVSAAPLVGLLGTVTGMLSTFAGLASGRGAEDTLQKVAGGISEALITTETGLVIALPGLFFLHVLGGSFSKYKAFLAHLETVVVQVRSGEELQARQERSCAARKIADALRAAVTRRRRGDGRQLSSASAD